MNPAVLSVTTISLGLGLWWTRGWGRSRWRWLIWPQAALMLTATEFAYLGRLSPIILAWPGADKVLHFLLWGLAAFWLELWLDGRRLALGRWALPWAVAAPLLLATLDELTQGLSPARTLDLGDWLCNAAGILTLGWLARRLTSRPSSGETHAHV